jgi:outer membrane lipoprotein LolB
MFYKPLFYLVLILLLSACVVRGPIVDQDSHVAWQQHRLALQALTEWGFDGRASVNEDRNSVKLNLRWRQSSGQFDIRLMSFLGQQQARLQSMVDGTVVLSLPGKPVIEAMSAGALMQQELGWTLPVDGLHFWVLGVPMPAMEADLMIDSQGRLEWLEQDGWRIEFSSYQAVAGLQLARKIRLYNTSLRIRLVLDRWLINDSAEARVMVRTVKER